MLKAIYLNAVLQLDNPDLSVARRQKLVDDLSHKTTAVLTQGTPSARLTGEIKQSKFVTESSGSMLKLIVYLEGEQEPAQNFTTLAAAELRTVIAGILAEGQIPMAISRVEENRNALEELEQGSDPAGS